MKQVASTEIKRIVFRGGCGLRLVELRQLASCQASCCREFIDLNISKVRRPRRHFVIFQDPGYFLFDHLRGAKICLTRELVQQ
jgi:hypothetical protein